MLGYVATPVIPALRRLRQDELKFQGNLSYKVRPCLKQTTMRSDTSLCRSLHVWPNLTRDSAPSLEK
jgi:hypothetical protein